MTPTELAAIFVANVHRLLTKKGMTQTALANALGVSSATVSKMLSGAAPPSGTTMAAVATALGVDPCELLCPKKGKR